MALAVKANIAKSPLMRVQENIPTTPTATIQERAREKPHPQKGANAFSHLHDGNERLLDIGEGRIVEVVRSRVRRKVVGIPIRRKGPEPQGGFGAPKHRGGRPASDIRRSKHPSK